MKKDLPILPIILAIALVLCCCLIVILGGAYYSFLKIQKALPTLAANLPVLPDGPTPTPFTITRQPPDQIPTATLKLLEQTNVPDNDLAELACRFKAVCGIAPTLAPPSAPFAEGAQQTFWVNNEDTNSYFQVHATLRYITPHSYFWVADGVRFNQSGYQSPDGCL